MSKKQEEKKPDAAPEAAPAAPAPAVEETPVAKPVKRVREGMQFPDEIAGEVAE